MHKVRTEVNKQIAEVVGWSLRWAAIGKYPERGFYDEPFENNSFRKLLSGKAIAGSYKPLII